MCVSVYVCVRERGRERGSDLCFREMSDCSVENGQERRPIIHHNPFKKGEWLDKGISSKVEKLNGLDICIIDESDKTC